MEKGNYKKTKEAAHIFFHICTLLFLTLIKINGQIHIIFWSKQEISNITLSWHHDIYYIPTDARLSTNSYKLNIATRNLGFLPVPFNWAGPFLFPRSLSLSLSLSPFYPFLFLNFLLISAVIPFFALKEYKV